MCWICYWTLTPDSDGDAHFATLMSAGSLIVATERATSITPCQTPANA